MSKKPNVLFVAVDDLRPELGCYGHPTVKSPAIDRLAERGMAFKSAYCQMAICMATRASLMSGYRPDKGSIYGCGPLFEHVPDALTLNQHFKDNGYRTVSIGKIYHHVSDEESGWDRVVHHDGEWQGRGYLSDDGMRIANEYDLANPDNTRRGMGPAFEAPDVGDSEYEDGMIADEAIRALRGFDDMPFFLGVGFKKPHLPFNAPKRYWDLYHPDEIALAPNPFAPDGVPGIALTNWGELRAYHGMPEKGPMPDDLARQLIHGYHACVSYMDAQLGRILDALDELGLADNTIVVLWGDHGWKLGEHGMWCKHTNFEIDCHVPLVVSAPGMKAAGRECSGLVEFVDVYPSLCELAGVPSPPHLQGTSFVPLLDDPEQSWKETAFSQYPHGKAMGYSMRTERYRYTEWRDREKGDLVASELYDLAEAGGENRNLADAPQWAEKVAELACMLRENWTGPAAWAGEATT